MATVHFTLLSLKACIKPLIVNMLNQNCLEYYPGKHPHFGPPSFQTHTHIHVKQYIQYTVCIIPTCTYKMLGVLSMAAKYMYNSRKQKLHFLILNLYNELFEMHSLSSQTQCPFKTL